MPVSDKTKPVRIFWADERALDVVAGIEHRSKAEVFRSALHEYLNNHRGELEELFHQTRQALAAGDVEKLLRLSSSGRDALVAEAMAEIDQAR
jgi:hypothetical protein